MKDKMTPEWIVKNFLPDYEERLKEWNIVKSRANQPEYAAKRGGLCRKAKELRRAMFSDALAEYSRQLCAKQREECKHNYVMNIGHDDFNGHVIDMILFAPMPEIR